MLTTLDDFLLRNLAGNGFQDYLLHHLPMDGGEADQPAVVCVFLLALLEEECDICFPPVFGHLPSITMINQDY